MIYSPKCFGESENYVNKSHIKLIFPDTLVKIQQAPALPDVFIIHDVCLKGIQQITRIGAHNQLQNVKV